MTGGEVLAIGGALALGGIALAAATKPVPAPAPEESRLSRAETAAKNAALATIDPFNLTGLRDTTQMGREAGAAAGDVGQSVGTGASQFGTGFAAGLGKGFEEHPVDTTVGFLVIGSGLALLLGIGYALRQPIKRAAGYGGYYYY